MFDISPYSDWVNLVGTPSILVVVSIGWYRIGRLESRVRGKNGGGLEERVRHIEINCVRKHPDPQIKLKIER